jgi:DNA invertase Pin-like site-specific DNA recombinase
MVIGAMAALEASLISERATAGVRAAEGRGRRLVGDITKRERTVVHPAL